MISNQYDRRAVLGGLAAGAAVLAAGPAVAAPPEALVKKIPSSGEALPAVGLGSWITFNVGDDASLRDECAAVMEAFFAAGGRMIDSSPMYGSSQATIGYGLAKLGGGKELFSAEKVWTSSGPGGPGQIEATRRLWGVPRFDLLQVHNLSGWESHIETLFEMKQAGALRYVGITTSEGRRHRDVEAIMAKHPIDFVQATYNPLDRDVERRILPLARERRIGVIVNRPFRQGDLTAALAPEPLPAWAKELGAASWAQVILKFVVSHPDVTCAIPATTSVAHVRENLAAAGGAMPDEALRARIAAHLADV